MCCYISRLIIARFVNCVFVDTKKDSNNSKSNYFGFAKLLTKFQRQ